MTVEVLDLSGRRVRPGYRGSDGIGEDAQGWDGVDDAGGLVPPGVPGGEPARGIAAAATDGAGTPGPMEAVR